MVIVVAIVIVAVIEQGLPREAELAVESVGDLLPGEGQLVERLDGVPDSRNNSSTHIVVATVVIVVMVAVAATLVCAAANPSATLARMLRAVCKQGVQARESGLLAEKGSCCVCGAGGGCGVCAKA